MRMHRSAGGIALALTASALLAACGTGSGIPSGHPGRGRVTFVEGVAGDPFYETMACGARAEAAKLGLTLDVRGASAWDVSLQSPLVSAAVRERPNVLFIAPNDSRAMIAPLKAASAAGVRIGLVDTTLTDTSFSSFAIATDNEAAGRNAADILAALISGRGSVLIAGLVPGVTTSEARARGFTEELKKYPDITYLGGVFTNDGGTSGISALVGAKIANTPGLKGIFAMAGDQTQGTADAIRAAGQVGRIKVVGFDARPAQVAQLRQGVVQALVAQEPAQIGKLAVDYAVKLIHHEPVPTMAGTPTTVITEANVDDPAIQRFMYTTACS